MDLAKKPTLHINIEFTTKMRSISSQDGVNSRYPTFPAHTTKNSRQNMKVNYWKTPKVSQSRNIMELQLEKEPASMWAYWFFSSWRFCEVDGNCRPGGRLLKIKVSKERAPCEPKNEWNNFVLFLWLFSVFPSSFAQGVSFSHKILWHWWQSEQLKVQGTPCLSGQRK